MEPKSENIIFVDELLNYLKQFKNQHRGVAIKILEEYLLLYCTCKRELSEIICFINNLCIPLSNLSGDVEYDSLSLAMLVGVSLVDLSHAYKSIESLCYYLKLEKSGSSSMLCLTASVCIINKLVINYAEIIEHIDTEAWIIAMTRINSSNQKKLSCAAILKIFENLSFS